MIMTILSSRWKALAFVLVLAVSGCTAAPYPQAQSGQLTAATGAAVTAPVPVETSNPVAAAPVAAEASNPAASVTPISAETMSHDDATSAGMEISTSAAAAPAGQVLAQGGVLYQDDFTDPKSGWPNNLEFGNYYIGYHEPNHYHVEVHVPYDSAVVAVPKRSSSPTSRWSRRSWWSRTTRPRPVISATAWSFAVRATSTTPSLFPRAPGTGTC